MFSSFGDFIKYLDSIGEVQHVREEVDPYLEITEIASRAIRERRKAIFFENVKGSRYPVVVNALASDKRCELALGRHPEEFGRDLIRFFGDIFPPKPSAIYGQRSLVRRFFSAPPRRVSRGSAQEVVESPDLDALPVLTCWPEDGGRFITLPQVITYDPRNGKRNMGMYRMHVFDKETTGMHWQIQKGGGFHYYQAEKLGKPFELAVAIGTDPVLLMATIAALPENIDEATFAGFLRGKRVEFTRGRSVGIDVPAHAEFILEGVVPLGERRMEGPFGDHFGHYSHAAEYPVFHVTAVTHKKNPIFPATVVGIPPMEDKFLGDATQQILGPLARLVHAEITDLWAYYEAGFHNLLVVAVDQRYAKESMKTALGLMGMSQLALTKCIVLVSEGVNVRDFGAVMEEVRRNFDPHYDFVMIPRVPLDTLDFTSFTMNLGSKMVVDATRKRRPQDPAMAARGRMDLGVKALQAIDRRIKDAVFLYNALLLVTVDGEGREVIAQLVRAPGLQNVPVVAAVSPDVDIRDRENAIWGLFTRFDCERDLLFSEQQLIGISPVYKGVMGIDATWKQGYPKPLAMTEEIIQRVDEKWERLWR